MTATWQARSSCSSASSATAASRQLANDTSVIVDTCLAFGWLRDKLACIAAAHDATMLAGHHTGADASQRRQQLVAANREDAKRLRPDVMRRRIRVVVIRSGRAVAESVVGHLHRRLLHVENVVHHQLVQHSITSLRVALGAGFLGFGVLKYFPGVSPAEGLTTATTRLLTFELVPDGVSIVAIATLECVIGACLLVGRWMRLAVWLLAVELVGILSPLVLLPSRLFAGPGGAPTLVGQYVLKDVVLIAAGFRDHGRVLSRRTPDPSRPATGFTGARHHRARC